jgi:hypothetical protein
MPDFIPVLVAGILCLLAMFLLFGGIITFEETPEEVTTYYGNEISLGANFSVADYQQGSKLVNLAGNVSAGIMSSADKSISFNAQNLDDVTYGRVSLKILNTNLYGPLVITINGNKIYNNVTLIGNHTIKFDKNILNSTENSLLVRAGGSGWRIWAPTMYIFNIDVYGDTSDVSTKTTEFNMTDVPAKASLRVYVGSRQGTGDLTVVINGYKVYKGKTNAYKSFDPDILKQGINTAEFTAESGSRYAVESAYIEIE